VSNEKLICMNHKSSVIFKSNAKMGDPRCPSCKKSAYVFLYSGEKPVTENGNGKKTK